MKKLPIKLTLLIFLLALLSGFYLKIPMMENFIRAFIVYVIFSMLILLVYILHNQSAYNMLKSELNKQHQVSKKGAEKSVTGESTK